MICNVFGLRSGYKVRYDYLRNELSFQNAGESRPGIFTNVSYLPFGLYGLIRFDRNGEAINASVIEGDSQVLRVAISISQLEADKVRGAMTYFSGHGRREPDPELVTELATHGVFLLPEIHKEPTILEDILSGAIPVEQASFHFETARTFESRLSELQMPYYWCDRCGQQDNLGLSQRYNGKDYKVVIGHNGSYTQGLSNHGYEIWTGDDMGEAAAPFLSQIAEILATSQSDDELRKRIRGLPGSFMVAPFERDEESLPSYLQQVKSNGLKIVEIVRSW